MHSSVVTDCNEYIHSTHMYLFLSLHFYKYYNYLETIFTLILSTFSILYNRIKTHQGFHKVNLQAKWNGLCGKKEHVPFIKCLNELDTCKLEENIIIITSTK